MIFKDKKGCIETEIKRYEILLIYCRKKYSKLLLIKYENLLMEYSINCYQLNRLRFLEEI